jgi:hypothetical protein
MAIYIHPENQKLLWENMLKIPNITSVFQNNSNSESVENWFKQIIQLFYTKYSSIRTKAELTQINKETILYMIHEIKEKTQGKQPTNPVNPVNRVNSVNPINILKKENTMDIQSQYDLRQREYQSMMENKLPEPIDFKESSADSVIQNMDELIQKHLSEREKDLQLFTSDKLERPETGSSIQESAIKKSVMKNSTTVYPEKPDLNNGILEQKIAILEQKIAILEQKIAILEENPK